MQGAKQKHEKTAVFFNVCGGILESQTHTQQKTERLLRAGQEGGTVKKKRGRKKEGAHRECTVSGQKNRLSANSQRR